MSRIVLTLFLIISLSTNVRADIESAKSAFEAGDYDTALELLILLADQGNAKAQNNLGLMYDEGTGVPQNYAEAVKWYRKAASQGDAVAQSNLASGLWYKLSTVHIVVAVTGFQRSRCLFMRPAFPLLM